MGLLHKLHIEDTIHAYVCSKSQHTLCHRSGYGQRECKWRFYTRTRTRTRTHTRTRTSKLTVAWKLNGLPWGRLDFSQKGKVFSCFKLFLENHSTLTHSRALASGDTHVTIAEQLVLMKCAARQLGTVHVQSHTRTRTSNGQLNRKTQKQYLTMSHEPIHVRINTVARCLENTMLHIYVRMCTV